MGWRISCDVGEVMDRLENELCYDYELCSFSNLPVTSPTSQLILQPIRRFTYITAHSPTPLSLLLRNRIFTYVNWRAAHALLYVKILESVVYALQQL